VLRGHHGDVPFPKTEKISVPEGERGEGEGGGGGRRGKNLSSLYLSALSLSAGDKKAVEGGTRGVLSPFGKEGLSRNNGEAGFSAMF